MLAPVVVLESILGSGGEATLRKGSSASVRGVSLAALGIAYSGRAGGAVASVMKLDGASVVFELPRRRAALEKDVAFREKDDLRSLSLGGWGSA
jgi:hypothetical protein